MNEYNLSMQHRPQQQTIDFSQQQTSTTIFKNCY